MNHAALVLALVATGVLGLVTLTHPGGLVPGWAPAALALGGVLPVGWGIVRSEARSHTAGALLQVGGLGLTGPFLDGSVAWLGTVGVVLTAGAWTLAQAVPQRPADGVKLSVAAMITALGAATLGWALSAGIAGIAGGGVDAPALLTAWVSVLAAITWALARWARRSTA